MDELKAFQAANSLAFELLSDDGAVAADYGVRVRQGFGPFSRERFRRSTFLLDRTGVVRRIFRDVDAEEHVNEVLAALDDGPLGRSQLSAFDASGTQTLAAAIRYNRPSL